MQLPLRVSSTIIVQPRGRRVIDYQRTSYIDKINFRKIATLSKTSNIYSKRQQMGFRMAKVSLNEKNRRTFS